MEWLVELSQIKAETRAAGDEDESLPQEFYRNAEVPSNGSQADSVSLRCPLEDPARHITARRCHTGDVGTTVEVGADREEMGGAHRVQ